MLLFEYPWLLSFVICVVLLLSYEIGFRLRARNHDKIGPDGTSRSRKRAIRSRYCSVC